MPLLPKKKRKTSDVNQSVSNSNHNTTINNSNNNEDGDNDFIDEDNSCVVGTVGGNNGNDFQYQVKQLESIENTKDKPNKKGSKSFVLDSQLLTPTENLSDDHQSIESLNQQFEMSSKRRRSNNNDNNNTNGYENEPKRSKRIQHRNNIISNYDNNANEIVPDIIGCESLFDGRERELENSFDQISSQQTIVDPDFANEESNKVMIPRYCGESIFNPSQFPLSVVKSVQSNNFEDELRRISEVPIDKFQKFNGDIGHIQEITLLNFMCHENFHLELGPRVNFIIGRNGSGKSAILNGIVLGLGGRASTTNRGSGLSTFIKNGESKAKIILRLANYVEGQQNIESSYQFDRYGKSIIIERTININGVSNYKIKSENGKTVSEKKEELDNILRHHSILIDNPICILTQEVSKNFLNSKSPADKFKFFVKATQIEDAKNDYESSSLDLIKAQNLLKTKEESIGCYQKDLDEYQRKVEIIEIIRNNVRKCKSLNEEALWANIVCLEKKLDVLTEKLAENNQKFLNCTKELEKLDNEIVEIKTKKDELMVQSKNFNINCTKAKEEMQESQKKAMSIREKLTEKEVNLRVIKKEFSYLSKQIDDLKQRIGVIEKNSQERPEIENNVDDLNSKRSENLDKQKELQEKISEIDLKTEQLLSKRIKISEEERRANARILSYKTELERLNLSQKHRLARYGSKFPELNSKIDEAYSEKKFRCKPFGPIGEYIRLKDSSASYAVECCLKTFLFSYVVDNADDARLLNQLISRVFSDRDKKPSVIIRKYKKLHDVSRKQAISDKYQNFLQLLNIDSANDPVANSLIDHLSIEHILYIPDFEEAQTLLIRPESVPKNCITAYTSDGDLLYASNERTDYKCYANDGQKLPKILVEDHAKQQKQYESMIVEHTKNYNKLREEMKSLCQTIDDNKKNQRELNQQINELKMELLNIEGTLSKLKAQSEVVPVEVQVLKEEAQKFEEERNKYGEEIKQVTEERSTLSEQYKELAKEVDEKQAAYSKLLKSRGPIDEEIEDLAASLNVKSHQIKSKEKEKEDLLVVKHDYQKEIDSKKTQLLNEEQNAMEITKVRIETDRTPEQIMREIKLIKMTMEKNRDMCDENQQNLIIEKFQELNNAIDKVKKNKDQLAKVISELERSLRARQKAFLRMRFMITEIVDFHFRNFLKQKNFIGRLKVYFRELEDPETGVKKKGKILEIEIQPREEFVSQQSGQNSISSTISYSSTTKSLSGGERSYSTVAFIMALWQICPSPFKILDEVDVFMDVVTRKIALDSLVTFAAVKSTKQFIFLTPLSLQQFSEQEDCIKIVQMPEPERNTQQ